MGTTTQGMGTRTKSGGSRPFSGSDRVILAGSNPYNRVTDFDNDAFNTVSTTIYSRQNEILNFFINRATNASAESFHSKIKLFRAQLRGVSDVKFFLYRLKLIFG